MGKQQRMIDVVDLEFHYRKGEFSLHIPRLHIDAGEKVAVIGPSGTGKTTFLNLVSGIFTPASGSVSVNGADLPSQNDAARRSFRIANIGFVFQDFELLEYLTVLDNILHPYRLNRTLRLGPEVRSRARRIADDMGLGDKLRRYPDQLSQGEKQRAAICRALLPEPGLLLADEPTGNLDPANKDRILELLFNYVDAHQATLVAVTHDHSLLDGFDRVFDFADFQMRGGHVE